MSFLQHLGLNEIPADPNEIPDSEYDGEISRSEFVFVESKGSIAHVTTFKVTEGEYTGAERQKWDTLYIDVKGEDGQPLTKRDGESNEQVLTRVKSVTPAMTKQNKTWYKKFWMDLGIPEAAVDNGTADPKDLVGKKVTFGVKTNKGYKNVNYSRLRDNVPQGPVNMGITSSTSPGAGAASTADSPFVDNQPSF